MSTFTRSINIRTSKESSAILAMLLNFSAKRMFKCSEPVLLKSTNPFDKRGLAAKSGSISLVEFNFAAHLLPRNRIA